MGTRRVLEGKKKRRPRRRYTTEFKSDAVQMLLDGHTAASVCEHWGLSSPTLLYRWKQEGVRQGGVSWSACLLGCWARTSASSLPTWNVIREPTLPNTASAAGSLSLGQVLMSHDHR